MKVFTFGRAAQLAMLGGAAYYVRKNGGLRATWNLLTEKLKPLAEQVKQKAADVVKSESSPAPTPSPVPVAPAQDVSPTSNGSSITDFGDRMEKGPFGNKTNY